jgi:hypothetical protein
MVMGSFGYAYLRDAHVRVDTGEPALFGPGARRRSS